VGTGAGFDAIGAYPPAQPQLPAELLAMWGERLLPAVGRILDALIDAHPDGLGREDLAERTGLTASGGTFGAAADALRRYGLVYPSGKSPRASRNLIELA